MKEVVSVNSFSQRQERFLGQGELNKLQLWLRSHGLLRKLQSSLCACGISGTGRAIRSTQLAQLGHLSRAAATAGQQGALREAPLMCE